MRDFLNRSNLRLLIPMAAIVAIVSVTIAPRTDVLGSDEGEVDVMGEVQFGHSKAPEELPQPATEDLFPKITPDEEPVLRQPAPDSAPKISQGVTAFSQTPVTEELALDESALNTPDSASQTDPCDRIVCTAKPSDDQLQPGTNASCNSQLVVFNNRPLAAGAATVPVDVFLECTRYDVILTSSDESHASSFGESETDVEQTNEAWYLEGLNADGEVIYASPTMIELQETDTSLTITVHSADLRYVTQLRAVHAAADGEHDLNVSAVLAPVAVATEGCLSAVPATMIPGQGGGWTTDLDLSATGCLPEGATMTGWSIGVDASAQRFHHNTLDRVSFTADSVAAGTMMLYPTIEVDGEELPFGSLVTPTVLG